MIALVIALLGGYTWFKGMKDAGEETMLAKKSILCTKASTQRSGTFRQQVRLPTGG